MPSLIKQLAQSAVSVFGIRTEDQPYYSVIDRIGDVEVRSYGVRGAVETTVSAENVAKARSDAFGILAGYIFGGNRELQELAMTAPVSTETSADRLKMRFFLPPGVSAASAPIPSDSRVSVVKVPEETLAVLRFTGSWAQDAITGRQIELIKVVQTSSWKRVGEPYTFFYDPPFALPFLRRNEVAVRVERN